MANHPSCFINKSQFRKSQVHVQNSNTGEHNAWVPTVTEWGGSNRGHRTIGDFESQCQKHNCVELSLVFVQCIIIMYLAMIMVLVW